LQCPVGVQRRETSIGVDDFGPGPRQLAKFLIAGEPAEYRGSGRHRGIGTDGPEAFTADDALADRFSDLGVIAGRTTVLGLVVSLHSSNGSFGRLSERSARSINERARSREVLVSGAAYPLRCARAFARATLSLICARRSRRRSRPGGDLAQRPTELLRRFFHRPARK
jgi:hypothetical protein